ncbi:sodium-translocating pyrophosphatase [Carboxylicivirga marina]|uniref:Putative K(+)-stimulated pyrophosphate-energized sodium pump n=1 Tax=Carboxylicivirga marina TaxID=2800988 RepID=A0ABS1HF41_9BACT|nr:sodium-translocating pyrophosphatase [Carboxylicivirga marina]MBK3516226.1 sodium-translocating pyrophosphatase [Carboxylicivirga marina]
MNSIFWFIPFASILALVFAWIFFKSMMKESEGTDKMKEIAQHVRDGAMAYLSRQYKVVSIVFLVLLVILTLLAVIGVQNPFVPIAFLTGGFFSGLCGFLGMKTATFASARTAHGASISLNRGLKVAFRSGAVMGLVVVGFGLIDIALWYWLLNYIYDNNVFGLGLKVAEEVSLMGAWTSDFIANSEWTHAKMVHITTTMLTFGMGASTQALFARVGGGIYTKAADVGADLVGKVEAGIPEDDPRNPATIADNVGDNVGDVAGMGADLYESYCGSILATAALGAAISMNSGSFNEKAIIAPMVVAAIGIIFSILGVFMVRTKEDANAKSLLNSLLVGTAGSSVLILIAIAVMAYLGWFGWGIFGSVVAGLIAGIVIGQGTEYYTSDGYKPTQGIARQAQQGPATTIIDGIAVGMYSTWIPVLTIVAGIIASFGFAGGFTNFSEGVYGIGFAAVGMLSTLGITLATDAFGPIADNAGGNAEMAELPKEVRERTDALDMLGNTTAATGKGFAIGSAALTAMALLVAYMEEVRIWLKKVPELGASFLEKTGAESLTKASIQDFVDFYELNMFNPLLLAGLFIGAMMPFVFCAMTMKAVGRAAGAMVDEVRRQFKEIPGILEGTGTPEYAKCVAISTKGAQREMMVPSILAIAVPIIVGLVFGVAGVIGLLMGGLVTGFTLAVMLNNAGGAWDNAKKYIEKGNYGGKGSEAHHAGVVGDTVGDPFKDTSGPSLNILIKLMTMVSVVMSGLTVIYSLF